MLTSGRITYKIEGSFTSLSSVKSVVIVNISLIYCLCIFGFLFSCQQKQERKDKYELYKIKYSEAIFHYSNPKDSLKLKALYYILENLNDQYFYEGDWIDAYNKTILISKDRSSAALNNELDSINSIYPKSLLKIKDSTVISNANLINNIDRAFETRKNSWASHLDFNTFCQYVLPYKIGDEKPEEWGLCLTNEPYLRRDSLAKISNIFKAVAYVNDHLGWYQGTIDYDYPVDAGYNMSKIVGTGTCNSMTRIVAFETRAIGLPVSIDYAVNWGNRSEGHSWNALIYKGRTYPFDANGPNIGFYKIEFKGLGRIPYKISKVFRKTFARQSNSLAALAEGKEIIPELFYSDRIIDVTDQYVPVANITLNYHQHFKNGFAYLCTFDNTKWTPCYWGEITDKSVTFKNMAKDIVYLPVLYSDSSGNKKLEPIGNPFILHANGISVELKPDMQAVENMVITRKYPEDATNVILKGEKYELFFWNREWVLAGAQVATSNKLYFKGVPINTLYWIRDLTEGKQERIFTYENGKQVWW